LQAIAEGLTSYKRALAAGQLTVSKRVVVDSALRRLGLYRVADGEAVAYGIEQPQSQETLQREWAASRLNEHGVPLQDEFGDFQTVAAFRQHERAGDITICGGKRSCPDMCLPPRDSPRGRQKSVAGLLGRQRRSRWDVA
jgi:hypothetical protein